MADDLFCIIVITIHRSKLTLEAELAIKQTGEPLIKENISNGSSASIFNKWGRILRRLLVNSVSAKEACFISERRLRRIGSAKLSQAGLIALFLRQEYILASNE